MTAQNPQTSVGNAWELSLYELHRKPHEMVSDSSAIAVSPRSLHSELMCPICLDLMRNTQTTKECLHRFCQECIITALRSGNKECPTCRKKLVSKRSLRPDPNFDKLIAKIYPNRDELNAQQEKQVTRRAQPIHRRKRRAETPPSDGEDGGVARSEEKRVKLDEPDDGDDVLSLPSSEQGSIEEVEIQIRPHPHLTNPTDTAIKNLLTSQLCTVSHLIRYIGMNPDIGLPEQESVYRLYAQMGDEFACLSSTSTLQQIFRNQCWTSGENKLKLFFTAGETTPTNSVV